MNVDSANEDMNETDIFDLFHGIWSSSLRIKRLLEFYSKLEGYEDLRKVRKEQIDEELDVLRRDYQKLLRIHTHDAKTVRDALDVFFRNPYNIERFQDFYQTINRVIHTPYRSEQQRNAFLSKGSSSWNSLSETTFGQPDEDAASTPLQQTRSRTTSEQTLFPPDTGENRYFGEPRDLFTTPRPHGIVSWPKDDPYLTPSSHLLQAPRPDRARVLSPRFVQDPLLKQSFIPPVIFIVVGVTAAALATLFFTIQTFRRWLLTKFGKEMAIVILSLPWILWISLLIMKVVYLFRSRAY